MARILKFPTGATVPEGAKYLSTVTQTSQSDMQMGGHAVWYQCWLVWHYFLVDDKAGE